MQLSEGALAIIMGGGEVSDPIMQVLGSKKINSVTAEKERYRILLSDGKNTISFAMLTTQINDKVGANATKSNTVIKLKKYITSVINSAANNDTRVLLILDLEIVAPGDEVGAPLGETTPLVENDLKAAAHKSSKASYSSNAVSNGTSNATSSAPVNLNQSSIGGSSQVISPISSLSPYHNRWVIKARVSNKSNIRTWSNSRGEGKLFSMDLIDMSGEIRCTAFKEMVDKYYDYIQVDKIYYISKCQLKPANKQFSTLKNDYEMTMSSETIVEECLTPQENIPQATYDFMGIDKLANMEVGSIVDVIGVCKGVSDLQTIVARSTGRELKKKELTLVDQSKNAITLTLWGAQAESFENTNNPVVVVKAAKVGEFGGGKNLSTLMSSQLKINPDISECHRLKGWYDSEGCHSELNNISARSGFGGGMQTAWMNFKETRDQNLGQSDRGDYYQVMGTILLFRSENAVYKACPTEECNKKVIDLENGMYRCEKCNREYPNFKYRLLASVNVGDWTGNQWISMFSSEAEKILGKTSQEVGLALENKSLGEAAIKIFDNANFKQFVFKCRAKMETYNDEARLKTVAVNVSPLNYEDYNTHLIEEIKKYIS